MSDRQTVFIIDDSLMICRQLRIVLQEEAIEIVEAHSAGEALMLLDSLSPDLILLDVILPDAQGYDLYLEIKKKVNSRVPIIFLTAQDSEEDVYKGFSLGASDYIKKPFQPNELRSRLRARLQEKRERDQLILVNETLRANMEKLNRAAYRDELTGLYNRRFMMEKLAQDLEEHGRQDALIMLDVDNFKIINDSYGHEAGDTVLVCIANIMEGICRRHKVIRWGGEEFLIVLMAVTGEEVQRVAEEIRVEIERFTFPGNERAFYCTATLGVTLYDKACSLKKNIARADKALYAGKTAGKNRVVWSMEEEK